MWNFAGRQNDIQGHGEVSKGNWISGFNFIDKHIAGDQTLLPSDLKDNKGHNVFYMMPLILGLIGLFYQAYSGQKGIEGFWITFFLFFMTGLAIVIYLNQTPYQPRERDYAYAGSFYAFAIWIGLGVAAISKLLQKKVFEKRPAAGAALAAVICLCVPAQMVSQTWDDHDRSGRYAARDFGMNYLSCVEEDGIIFTNGDNETFPLWYAQETEGFRTDVRVCNLSYLQTDWYVGQMMSQAYESSPLPINMEESRYGNNRLVFAYIIDLLGGDSSLSLDAALQFLMSEEDWTKRLSNYDGRIDIIPSHKLHIDVDSAAAAGCIPRNLKDRAVKQMVIDLSDKNGLMLNEIAVLSILNSIAKDGWKRPVYYAATVSPDMYVNLDDYFVSVGMANRILPVKANNKEEIMVDIDKMYDNMMNKFRFGGIDNPDIYLDENIRRMSYTLRMMFIDLADALINENDSERALKVIDYMMEKIPSTAVRHDYLSTQVAYMYYSLGEKEKGLELMKEIADNSLEYVVWYYTLTPSQLNSVSSDMLKHEYTLKTAVYFMVQEGETETAEKYIRTLSNMGYDIFEENTTNEG